MGFPLVVLMYLVLNLPFIDSYPAIDRLGDESWYMNYSVELIKTGRIKSSMFPVAGNLNEGNLFAAWLYNGALSGFLALLGKGIWQGRMLSLVCGIGILLVTYRIGRDFFCSREVGIVASAFLAAGIFFGLSTREIRPEAMFTLLLTASYYFFYKFLASKKDVHVFVSALLMGLLIEVHPNAVVACLSLVILYAGLCLKKVFSRSSVFLALGFIVPGLLWVFLNYLPYERLGLSSFQTVHREYMPGILSGDWAHFLDIISHAPMYDLLIIFRSPAVYLNYINMAIFFLAGIGVFIFYIVRVRTNLSKILLFVFTALSLWFSEIILSLNICQPTYLTYFMPLFALILASTIVEIRAYARPVKDLSFFIAVLVCSVLAANAVDTAATDLRFREYKKRYDVLMQGLKSSVPQDSRILGSTNYYQAFPGSDRYYTYGFMQNSCPDFGLTVNALDVDYVIFDDMLRSLSSRWCGEAYFEKIRVFLEEKGEPVKSMEVGYPNINGTEGMLREVHIFRIRQGASQAGRGEK